MTTPASTPIDLDSTKENITRLLDRDADALGILPLDRDVEGEVRIAQLRRGRKPRSLSDDTTQTISLVLENGVLRWHEGMAPTVGGEGRRGRGTGIVGGDVVTQRKFAKLGTSQIPKYLEDMDNSLNSVAFSTTPLREWKSGKLMPVDKPAEEGKLLVFVHGTFSSCDKLFDDFIGQDPTWLEQLKLANKYDQILAFDHATLSVSPILNALDLARIFNGSKADIDVICHSRGGLVTRWWLEAFDRQTRNQRRVVMVASPLGGTSLAAPNKLRNGLDLMASMGGLMSEATSLIPFLTVASGLMRIFSSVTKLAAKTPIVDAVVAMIPGLAGQSRIANSLELNRLRYKIGLPPDYFTVTGNFEPIDVGWQFWKAFADWKQRGLDLAADTLVFNEANDLVVDTASMDELPYTINDTLTFKDSGTVHHCNYFRQAETLKFIAKNLT